MSILDEGKAPDQLRRDQWNQQYQEWAEAAAIAASVRAFPNSGMIIITTHEPGRAPRRSYLNTFTVHL